LLHLPTSIEVPFGISVRIRLFVPGDFRKLVSAVVSIGLASAPIAGRRVKIAAHAAIRTELMAVLFSFRCAATRAVI
jgi:hypothetical protein